MKWFGKRSAEQHVDTEWMQPEEKPNGYQPGDRYTDPSGNVWEAFAAPDWTPGRLGWQMIQRAGEFSLWSVVLYTFSDGPEGYAKGNIAKVIFCVTEQQAWEWVQENKPLYYDVVAAADR